MHWLKCVRISKWNKLSKSVLKITIAFVKPKGWPAVLTELVLIHYSWLHKDLSTESDAQTVKNFLIKHALSFKQTIFLDLSLGYNKKNRLRFCMCYVHQIVYAISGFVNGLIRLCK